MFYSHEILTDRKHGVATIWLVATLGSKSSLKKITRKAIMDVNVPNACDTITDPVAPMALRLQGNLLYGVSRVFSQQCAYVLTDMESLRDKMRGIAIILKELETDPNVVAARPEQLNLPTNPTFNIDLDIGFDLSNFDNSYDTEPSSLLSPRTLASSQTSFHDDGHFLAAASPLDHSLPHDVGEDLDFGFDDIDQTIRQSSKHEVHQQDVEAYIDQQDLPQIPVEEGSLLDIAEDGSIIVRDPSLHDAGSFDKSTMSDYALAGDVAQSHGEQVFAAEEDGAIPMGFSDSLSNENEGMDFVYDEDPERRLYSPSLPQSEHDSINVQQTIEGSDQADEHVGVIASAAQQRAKTHKPVPVDNPAEVPNRVLAEWNDNYMNIMASARIEKAARISVAQAKSNAAFWVLDQGLGDSGTNFREDIVEHPLIIFSGQTLLNALVGPPGGISRKRAASLMTEDDQPGSSQDSRRVRSRSNQQIQSQGDAIAGLPDAGDEQDITFIDDDVDAEVGRQQQAPLSDHLSDMPWNTYGSSRQGSIRRGMSAAAVSSSAGRQGTFDVNILSSNVKRISQLIRDSPLEHRGGRGLSALRGMSSQRDATDTGSLGGGFDIDDDELDAQLAANPDEEFELFGPGADVSTQEATTGGWVSATLEKEALNFLEFLRTTIGTEDDQGTLETDSQGKATTTFEDLLPPANNNEIVAAQGLLHVLSLATSGLIRVKQDKAFGTIRLSVDEDSMLSEVDDAEFAQDGTV